MATCITAAVGAPALYTMHTTPRTVIMYLRFVGNFCLLQELTVVCQTVILVSLNIIKTISQRHVTMLMMMTIRLTISSDVHKLRVFAFGIKLIHKRMREFLTIIQ